MAWFWRKRRKKHERDERFPEDSPVARGNELLRRLQPMQGPLVGAEVGVFTGGLSRHLLQHRDDLRLLMIDRWQAVGEDHPFKLGGSLIAQLDASDMAAAMDLAKQRVEFAGERAVLIQGESVEAARDIDDGSLDFAFVDADHSFEAVLADIEAYWPKIRAGGWLSGHDWDHGESHVDSSKKLWGVKQAVQTFFPGEEIQLGDDMTWFVQKT